MEISPERVISIALNEDQWQAFIRLHPQPVVWLRERIQESLNAPIVPVSAAGAANTTSATTQ